MSKSFDNLPFLIELPEVVDPFCSPTIEIVRCKFNVANFRYELFDEFSVECPKELKSAANKRYADFLAGRIVAQTALKTLDAPIHVKFGSDRAPVWPKGFCGSISHSGKIAIAACSSIEKNRSIGIDIETADTKNIESSLIPLTVSLKEVQKVLTENNNLDQSFAALLIYSAKESIFKAVYPHVLKYFDYLDVSLLEYQHNTQVMKFVFKNTISPSFVCGDHIYVSWRKCDDAILTLCSLHQ